MSHKPLALVDLHTLGEDERITLIGRVVVEQQKTAAVCVDDQAEKVARYVRKLSAVPGLSVLSQEVGPTRGVVTIKVGPTPAQQCLNRLFEPHAAGSLYSCVTCRNTRGDAEQHSS